MIAAPQAAAGGGTVPTQRREVSAFAPGHVTGFFQIWDEHPNAYRRGSVGAGVSLGLGVQARVVMHAEAGPIEVWLNGERRQAPVIETALSRLLPDPSPRVVVHSDTPLPSGQGFGVSAAGALAAALATAKALGVSRQRAHWEAHRAEVEHRTGLGDVAAAWVGGFEMRVVPGVQPQGVVEPFAQDAVASTSVVLCAPGREISTAQVLADPQKRQRINALGGSLLEELRADPTVERFMDLSSRFAQHLGLADPRLGEALQVARRFGPASQAMLGDSLFLLLPNDESTLQEAKAALEPFGWTATCAVADRGASGLVIRPGGARRAPQRGPRRQEQP